MSSNRRLAAILFSDIAGYTAMLQRDEEEGLRKLRRYRQVLEEKARSYNGQVLKNYGDGSLTLFNSAVDAVRCALEIQTILQKEPVVPLRIGIHVGDVVLEDGDVYGDGVNLAARVEALGAPGAVLFTERVIHDIRSHPDLQTVSLGKVNLKNVLEPLEVFALSNEGFPVPGPEHLPGRMGMQHPVPKHKRNPFVLPLIILAGLAIAVITWQSFLENRTMKSMSEIPQKSVAVLPFEDLSPDQDQAFFSEGIAEEVLNALSMIPGLKIAGRHSSFALRSETPDLLQLGQKLDVRHVLEGSVRRDGDRIRITARLLQTVDGYQLWSQRYDRDAKDIFAVQDEIARAVVSNLQLALQTTAGAESPQAKIRTVNPQAYELYLRGRHLLSHRVDQPKEAAAFFQQALDIDPGFAQAYAGLGDAYLWLGWGAYLPGNEAFPKAGVYAQKALDLDSTLAYAYVISGSVQLWHDWNWKAAKESFERALQLNPSEGAALLDLGWYHAFTGNFPEAVRLVKKALDLDPLNLDYNVDLADIYRLSGNFKAALKTSQHTLELFPENTDTYWILGMTYYHLEDLAQAETAFRKADTLSGGQAWTQAHLAMVWAKSGRKKEARQRLLALDTDSVAKKTIPAELAMAYLALGETSKALDLLELSYQVHSNWLAYLQFEPAWTSLRQEPRFKALLAKLRFPG
jgi:adenylate cyclase